MYTFKKESVEHKVYGKKIKYDMGYVLTLNWCETCSLEIVLDCFDYEPCKIAYKGGKKFIASDWFNSPSQIISSSIIPSEELSQKQQVRILKLKMNNLIP